VEGPGRQLAAEQIGPSHARVWGDDVEEKSVGSPRQESELPVGQVGKGAVSASHGVPDQGVRVTTALGDGSILVRTSSEPRQAQRCRKLLDLVDCLMQLLVAGGTAGSSARARGSVVSTPSDGRRRRGDVGLIGARHNVDGRVSAKCARAIRYIGRWLRT
jgi:hypothetical protein